MSTDRTTLLSGDFVLPEDVHLIPVSELSEDVRKRIEWQEGDYALSRPRFRASAKIVNQQTAWLLEAFREPTPIAEVVVRIARRLDEDPQSVLESAFPLLERFSRDRILVPADSPWSKGVRASMAVGQAVGGFEIEELIQVVTDTEVYRARSGSRTVALKLARETAGPVERAMLRREAVLLGRLGGVCAPRLEARGMYEERPWLAMEWIEGDSPVEVAHDIRARAGRNLRQELHALLNSLFGAYTALHGRGVLHGDIHQRNLRVQPDGRVVLLDFGLASVPGDRQGLAEGPRSASAWFMEPEAAEQVLADGVPPPASFAGEQYAVAALAYLLLSGASHVEAPLEHHRFLAQVVRGEIVPLVRHEIGAWAAMERILTRALSRRPEDRFPDLASLLQDLAAARPEGDDDPTLASPSLGPAQELIEELLARATDDTRPAGAFFPAAPTASAHYGAAGMAWFLYRAAQMRESAELLHAADRWSRIAACALQDGDALRAPEVGMTPSVLATGAVLHSAAGVQVARALIDHARGDLVGARSAIELFLASELPEGSPVELFLGRSGYLLGGVLVLEACSSSGRLDTGPLADRLRHLSDDIWHDAVRTDMAHLGMAHGWAGVLYAQLRARARCGVPWPEGLSDRLDGLAAHGVQLGRGRSWPGTLRPDTEHRTPEHTSGWCAGTAGFVHLWCLAHRMDGRPHFQALAEQAAWYTWQQPDMVPHLCCGLAGRAFALLHLFQHTGDGAWLERARRLAERALESADRPSQEGAREHSLYRGRLGPLLLALELERPEAAAMPLFAAEGWPEAPQW